MQNHQNKQGIIIQKASGEEELFDVSKLKRSLHNAGADSQTTQEIVNDISKWLYKGATTKKIYARAFRLLRRKNNVSALRYKLKQALFELGPSGYPFEHFIGELFRRQGYEIEVGQILEGKCVTHEMDVIATKDQAQSFMECKYSVDQGKSISVQVPLYVRSRVNDIIDKRKQMPTYENYQFHGWVVTNARFSDDSIAYGKCGGLHLLSWNYPERDNLKEMIERMNIFPITILNHLTRKEKQQLMEKGLVICSQLLEDTGQLNSLGLNKRKYNNLIKELQDICNSSILP